MKRKKTQEEAINKTSSSLLHEKAGMNSFEKKNELIIAQWSWRDDFQ